MTAKKNLNTLILHAFSSNNDYTGTRKTVTLKEDCHFKGVKKVKVLTQIFCFLYISKRKLQKLYTQY